MITKDEIKELLTIDILIEQYTYELHDDFIEQFHHVFDTNPTITEQTLNKLLVLRIALTEICFHDESLSEENRNKFDQIVGYTFREELTVLQKLLALNPCCTEETLTLAVIAKDRDLIRILWKKGVKPDHNTLNASFLHLDYVEADYFETWLITYLTNLNINEKTLDILCVSWAHALRMRPYMHALINGEMDKINEYVINGKYYHDYKNIAKRIDLAREKKASIFIPNFDDPIKLVLSYELSNSLIETLQKIKNLNLLRQQKFINKSISNPLLTPEQRKYFQTYHRDWDPPINSLKSARKYLELEIEKDKQEEDFYPSSSVQNYNLSETPIVTVSSTDALTEAQSAEEASNQFNFFHKKDLTGKRPISSITTLEPPSKREKRM